MLTLAIALECSSSSGVGCPAEQQLRSGVPARACVGELLGALDAAGVAGLHAHADRTGRQRSHRQRRCSPTPASQPLFRPPLFTIAEAPSWRGFSAQVVGLLSADFVGDKVGGCGQLDINGNRFVDPKQRPQDYDDYVSTHACCILSRCRRRCTP